MSVSKLEAPKRNNPGVSHSSPSSSLIKLRYCKAALALEMPPAGL